MEDNKTIKILELYKDPYYVYEHTLDDIVFYVGNGTGPEALNFYNKDSTWNEVVKGNFLKLGVNIVKSFDNKHEALMFESQLVKTLLDEGVFLVNEMNRIKHAIISKNKESRIIDRCIGLKLEAETIENLAEIFQVKRLDTKKNADWQMISKVLSENEYTFENKTESLNGEEFKYIWIEKKEIKKLSPDARATKFFSKLNEMGFSDKNEENLSNYMGISKNVAFSHLRSSYKKLVASEMWSERKFADVTYVLAKKNELYSESNYIDYGVKYDNNSSKMKLLEIRSDYEENSKLLLASELRRIKRESL